MLVAAGWGRVRAEDMWLLKRLTDCKIYGGVPPAVRGALSTKKKVELLEFWESHKKN